jgi:hypothetical protein
MLTSTSAGGFHPARHLSQKMQAVSESLPSLLAMSKRRFYIRLIALACPMSISAP